NPALPRPMVFTGANITPIGYSKLYGLSRDKLSPSTGGGARGISFRTELSRPGGSDTSHQPSAMSLQASYDLLVYDTRYGVSRTQIRAHEFSASSWSTRPAG